MSDSPTRSVILAELDEIYRGPAWHGPALLEALDGVSAEQAAAKPIPDRHSIWELVRHVAYGRHLMRERLTETTSDFPLAVAQPWWPVSPTEFGTAAWKADLALLDDCHGQLRAAIVAATDAQLARVPKPGDQSLARQLLGTAIHDAYHAAQIILLRG